MPREPSLKLPFSFPAIGWKQRLPLRQQQFKKVNLPNSLPDKKAAFHPSEKRRTGKINSAGCGPRASCLLCSMKNRLAGKSKNPPAIFFFVLLMKTAPPRLLRPPFSLYFPFFYCACPMARTSLPDSGTKRALHPYGTLTIPFRHAKHITLAAIGKNHRTIPVPFPI